MRVCPSPRSFAELYVVDVVEEGTDDGVIDLGNPPPSKGAEFAVRGRDRIRGWHTRGDGQRWRIRD